MKHKISFLIFFLCAAILSSCGKSERSIKLSDITQEENKQYLLDNLSHEERQLLAAYVYAHKIKNDLDVSITVSEAIKRQRKDNEAAANKKPG